LAPAHHHPDGLEDVLTALTWAAQCLTETAREAPLAVGGDSAGDTLAANAALAWRGHRYPYERRPPCLTNATHQTHSSYDAPSVRICRQLVVAAWLHSQRIQPRRYAGGTAQLDGDRGLWIAKPGDLREILRVDGSSLGRVIVLWVMIRGGGVTLHEWPD
jgi:hypothetical protein